MPLDLPVRFMGRQLKPVALGFTLAAIILARVNMADAGIVRGGWATFFSVLWIATAVTLCIGWWARSQAIAEAGLLLVFASFFSRFMVAGLTLSFDIDSEGVYLSFCWAIIAGGSYFLERLDGQSGGRGDG